MAEDSVTKPGQPEPEDATGAESSSPDTGAGPAAAGAGPIEGDADPRDQWVFLVDPAWQPSEEQADPPEGAVVGGWFVDADGATGRFRPNPGYEPSEPGMPTDPVDASLQLVAKGEAQGDDLVATTPDIYFGVAVDEEGVAIVAPAPDDVPSLLVTTAPLHRQRLDVAGWVEVTVEELADALPEAGVDVLLNPGSPASMRVLAVALKTFVAERDRLEEEPGAPAEDDAEDKVPVGAAETR